MMCDLCCANTAEGTFLSVVRIITKLLGILHLSCIMLNTVSSRSNTAIGDIWEKNMRRKLIGILLSAAGTLSMSLSSSKYAEVVVFGSTAIDFVAYTSELPQRGETVFGTAFAKNFGGKGANQVS